MEEIWLKTRLIIMFRLERENKKFGMIHSIPQRWLLPKKKLQCILGIPGECLRYGHSIQTSDSKLFRFLNSRVQQKLLRAIGQREFRKKAHTKKKHLLF